MSYFVHETSVIDDHVSIGDGTKIWHFCHVQKGAVIGEGCSLGQNVNVASNVRIGKGCRLQNNVSIYQGVTLEDYVFCGPSCVFTNVLFPRAKYPNANPFVQTLLQTGATIGANATVVCGHTIGKWAMIGAGAVVAADVPDYALMLGTPARQHGWVCECGQRLPDDLACPACGKQYELTGSELREKAE